MKIFLTAEHFPSRPLASATWRNRRNVRIALLFAVLLLLPLRLIAQGSSLPNACGTASKSPLLRILTPVRSVKLTDSDTAPIASVTSLIASSRGVVAVLDRSDYNLKLFSPVGRLLRIIGKRGHGPGELAGPAAATFVGDSLIAVADERRGRLIIYAFDGTLRKEHPLTARPIGSMIQLEGSLVVGGLNGFIESQKVIAPHLAIAFPVPVSGEGRPLGKFPESYTHAPALFASPVYVAPRRATGELYVSWRLSNEVHILSLAGVTQRVVELPNHSRFVDARVAIERATEDPASTLQVTSPVVSMFAGADYVFVAYVPPGRGSRGMRYTVLDSDLRTVATDIEGFGIFGSVGDTLIAVGGASQEDVRNSEYEFTWMVRCK